MDQVGENVTNYVGILDGGNDVWGVTLPDILGCVGAGATPEEAISSAIEALRIVAEHLIRHGLELPNPSSVPSIVEREGLNVEAGESLVMVPLLLDSGRTVRANITLDAGLLQAVDSEAKLRGLTRSAFLASAARDKIAERR
jgi:predicted RNase H-like HicB family nuclease